MNHPLLHVGLVQMSMTDDPARNLEIARQGIRDRAGRGARLVVLPELFRSPYFCQTENAEVAHLAESAVAGDTHRQLSQLAAELQVVIVASIYERATDGLFNTALVFDSDGHLAGSYRKMHLPDDPGFFERHYFRHGDRGFAPISTSVGRLGVLVCWDQWFPEAARIMALAGADLLIYPTAIGWEPGDPADQQAREHDAWQTVQRGHAIANSLPLVSCNRHGREFAADRSLNFWGGSFICGQQGEFLARAGHDEEVNLVTAIDLQRTTAVRRVWTMLADRRPDTYQALCRRSDPP